MSGEPFVSVNGILGRSARLIVPWTGVPVVHVDFAGIVAPPAGPVQVQIGALALSCVLDPARSGDYADSSRWTLLGGLGGWQTTPAASSQHSDAIVHRSDAALSVASAVGETIVVDASADGPLGPDFFRLGDEAASLSLERLFPSSAWWVAPDGTTYVGERPQRDVTGLVDVLELDPAGKSATLIAEDLNNVLPGCSFSDPRLPGTFLIHDLEFCAEGTTARAMVTSSPRRDSRLAGIFADLTISAVPRLPFAFLYEYRVVSMASDRVYVQYVADPLDTAKGPEFPDGMPLSFAPGMAGLKAQLTPGSRVFVTFVAGNPGRPLIVAFGGPDAPGFAPLSASLDATSSVAIGAGAVRTHVGGEEASNPNPVFSGKRFLRVGDVISVVMPISGPTPVTLVLDATNPTMSTAGSDPETP